MGQHVVEWSTVETKRSRNGAWRAHNVLFAASKRVFDYGFCLAVVPLGLVLVCMLLFLNPLLNPGPLFFVQRRMGKHGRPFNMVKFRSMVPRMAYVRSHNDGVELDRITHLGAFLRRSRIDELPNLINVLRGEMSVVGPRPDIYDHAQEFSRVVPSYRSRHRVRPGITGLAQVQMGYAAGLDETRIKAELDAKYVDSYGFRQEAYILGKTVSVVLTGYGAR